MKDEDNAFFAQTSELPASVFPVLFCLLQHQLF
jgi:hypothetical protein